MKRNTRLLNAGRVSTEKKRRLGTCSGVEAKTASVTGSYGEAGGGKHSRWHRGEVHDDFSSQCSFESGRRLSKETKQKKRKIERKRQAV